MNSRAQKLVAIACTKRTSTENLESDEENFTLLEKDYCEVTTLGRLKKSPLLQIQNTVFIHESSAINTKTDTTEHSLGSPSLIHLEDLDIVQKSLDCTILDYDIEGNEIIAEIEIETNNDINEGPADLKNTLTNIVAENQSCSMNNNNDILVTNNTNIDNADVLLSDQSPNNENTESQENISNNITEQKTDSFIPLSEDTSEINKTGRPKRGRKRKIEDQSRKDRKRRANVNEKYVNAKGKEVPPKLFDQTFHCGCKKKCTEIVSSEDRNRIFDQFWSLGSYEGRCAYICDKVKQTNKARCYSSSNSKRVFSRKYFLYDTEICKKTFLKTLGICQSRIDLAIQKRNSSSDFKDYRGIAGGGNNRTNENTINRIVDHINSFPKYVSHYCREKTSSRYLCTDLNLSKMYDLFKSKYSCEENLPSVATYKKIFYEKFNLKFKPPKSDTCKTCDAFAANIKSLSGVHAEESKQMRNEHLNKASALRDKMNTDLKLASECDFVDTLTFDMQKTHPLPKIPSNIAFYKRQLNLYNLGIYIGSSKRSLFNLWLEYEAGKGTQEVGSCLRKYILNNIQFPVTDLILWSDSCGGQNRSIKLVLMLIHTMQHHTSLRSITLRFLLSGHSFLPNDANFGVIETQLKMQQRLYTLDDYAESITKSKKHKKFEVFRMLSSDMMSVQPLEKAITNRKVDSAKIKVNWLNVHEIVMEKDYPYILKIKNNIDQEDPQVVNIEKAGKGRKPSFKNVNLPECWPNGKPLSKEKIKDLKELMKLVPTDAKAFYDFLKTAQSTSIEEDVEGYHIEDIENLFEDEAD